MIGRFSHLAHYHQPQNLFFQNPDFQPALRQQNQSFSYPVMATASHPMPTIPTLFQQLFITYRFKANHHSSWQTGLPISIACSTTLTHMLCPAILNHCRKHSWGLHFFLPSMLCTCHSCPKTPHLLTRVWMLHP